MRFTSIIFFSILLLACQNKPTTDSDVKSDVVVNQAKEKNTQTKAIKKKSTSPTKKIETPEKTTVKKTNPQENRTKPKPTPKKKSTPAPIAKPKKQPKKTQPPPKKVAKLAEIEFEKLSHDFGEIMEGDKISHKFTFKNTGNAPLSISKANATCGCTQPSFPFIDINPGETGYIGVDYYSVNKDGPQSPEITVYTNTREDSITLTLTGIVNMQPEEDSTKVEKGPF